ncbi:MAG: photosynthetic reaction center cytochrome PufC [Betaproteobacteria bacterium]|jgi:photosynthetic reaction center cytochrome c subunit
MMKRTRIALAALAAGLLLAGCERPPIDSVQHGYRGTGMVQVYNPRTVAEQIPNNVAPEALPAVPADGPKAGEVYQNVKVLGHLSVGEFTRYMTAMSSWIAPEQSCEYCHNLANFAEDSKYTKVVARRMIEMTQHVNSNYRAHVGQTGVTCHTCHRGNAVPAVTWSRAVPQDLRANFIGDKASQNTPVMSVGLSSLPYDPFSEYFKDAKPIRVYGTEALPYGNRASIKQAEFTYGLMMHMSTSLGVNCTYCHNSRSFGSWDGPPQRAVAWHGINMVRDLNVNYIEPLQPVFPANRLGEMGDPLKANCGTCHQGAYKPLYGAQMLKDYPELSGPGASAATVAAKSAMAGQLKGTLAKLLFAVNKSEFTPEASAMLAEVAKALASNPATKVDLSGYADRTGNAARNVELAKQRAFAVRDALKAAGVSEDRINLKKPEFAVGGTSDESRRVDVIVSG